MVCEFEPHMGLAVVRAEPTLNPLSPSLSVLPTPVLSLSKMNKHFFKCPLQTSPQFPKNSYIFLIEIFISHPPTPSLFAEHVFCLFGLNIFLRGLNSSEGMSIFLVMSLKLAVGTPTSMCHVTNGGCVR